jgi:hypothetical protein
MSHTVADDREKRQPLWHDALQQWTLCAFAIAQPVYDLLAKNVAFFVARGSQPLDLWVFVAVLSIGLPALIIAPISLLSLLGTRTRVFACSTLVFALASCIAIAVIGRVPGLLEAASLGLSLGVGLAFAFGFEQFAWVRKFLSVLSPAVLLFPAWFLFGSPVRGIVMPSEHSPMVRVTSDTPVVIVIFDGLPVAALMTEAMQIDAEAYPHFARLADGYTWFRNATTVATSTDWAIPALLTARYPTGIRAPVVDAYPENLFTWLGRSYRISAFEYATQLCPRNICDRKSAPRGADLGELLVDTIIVYLHIITPGEWIRSLPPISSDWHGFVNIAAAPEGGRAVGKSRNSSDANTRSGRLVASRDPRMFRSRAEPYSSAFDLLVENFEALSEKSLLYVHIVVPHGPYELLPSGRTYTLPGVQRSHMVRVVDGDVEPLRRRLGSTEARVGHRAWGSNDDLIGLAVQRHLLQVAAADRILGELLGRLQQSALYHRALVVVTSDHGESYTGPVRSPKSGNTVHVPLFIKFPEQRDGRVDERNAELIDILPTIADVLGAEVPWAIDGRSLAAPPGEPRATKNVFNGFGTTRSDWPDDRLERALDRINALVGPRRVRSALTRSGPSPELVDQHIGDFEQRGDRWLEDGLAMRRLRFAVQQERHLTKVDLESDFVPAYLTGKIIRTTASRQVLDLALVLNGVIRATTRSYAGVSSTTGFAVMIPESSFRSGSNELEIYAIESVSD